MLVEQGKEDNVNNSKCIYVRKSLNGLQFAIAIPPKSTYDLMNTTIPHLLSAILIRILRPCDAML